MAMTYKEKYLDNLVVGQNFGCSTSEFSYCGTVKSVHETFIVLTDGIVDKKDIFWCSEEGRNKNNKEVDQVKLKDQAEVLEMAKGLNNAVEALFKMSEEGREEVIDLLEDIMIPTEMLNCIDRLTDLISEK